MKQSALIHWWEKTEANPCSQKIYANMKYAKSSVANVPDWPDRMWSWATCSIWTPLSREVGKDDLHRHLPISAILWSYKISVPTWATDCENLFMSCGLVSYILILEQIFPSWFLPSKRQNQPVRQQSSSHVLQDFSFKPKWYPKFFDRLRFCFSFVPLPHTFIKTVLFPVN